VNIIVNTRLLVQNKLDGIGRFTLEVLKRMTYNNPNHEFHFIFDRPFPEEFIFNTNITPHILSPSTRHPILWYIWFEIQLPKLINQIKGDLFFSPDGFVPTTINIPIITTIHDINFEHRPKDLKWLHSLFYRFYFKKYAEISTKIITVSHFSKEDIIKTYGIKPNKIDVVYNGVSDEFKQLTNNEKIKIKNKYSNGHDFFIFIGSLHKRKNIKNLLISFDEFKKNHNQMNLIIAGEKKWLDIDTKKTYQSMQHKQNVIFLGKVPQTLLPKLLGSAKGLCFISFFEGFGLPIIEAMKSGIPIITSNTSAMPEIAQDAAIIINPHNIREISHAMYELETNNSLRLRLIKNGQRQVMNFNWNDTANSIWNIINSTHNNHYES
tara:strand:+ start:1831 stop:2967 length:1137 start_codon:yes stop_codon:yes gene_type:complete